MILFLVGSICIPTYPTGHIGMMMCEKQPSTASSMDEIKQRWNSMVDNNNETSYYHPPMQQG